MSDTQRSDHDARSRPKLFRGAGRKAIGALLASLLALPIVFAAAAPAGATTNSTGTFVYNGSNPDTKTVIDTGLQYVDGCIIGDDPVTCFPDDFPGTAWFRVQAGVKFTVVTAQTADFSLSSPDSFRQDTTAPFTATLTTKDAAGDEVTVTATPFLNVDIAYDAPLANCPKNTITTLDDLANADTSGCLNAVLHTGEVDLGNFNIFSKSLLLPYSGTATATDTQSSPALDIGALFGIPDLIKVRLDLDVKTALDATVGYHADRVIASASNPGTPLASGTINFPSANPVDDNVQIPCSAPVGDNLVYKLSNNSWDGTGRVDVTPKIVIVTPLPDITIPLGFSVNLFNAPISAQASPDFTAVLGDIKPDAQPPVIGAVTAPDGNEGSPITFGAAATDNCGTPSLRWDFSDGGVAFGPSPQHTFADNGLYSGIVTATDAAGNTATKTFSVNVSNVAPSVNAGPDTTSDWGRAVAFNGQSTDPGSADQSTLQYSWDFGDGTPSTTGGPSVLHSYASPGVNGYYDATLTVCDKDGGCNSDARRVFVTKRDTTTSYLGDTAGTFDTPASLGASLVDEYGQTVNGRSITFQVGTDGPLVALTNSSGIATKSYTPTLAVGAYSGSSTFAGDSLYNSSNSSNGFNEAKKATGITYTGAVTGGPNKIIVLSGVLKDATGKPLANKLVNFQLGSQSVNGVVTDASGVASTTLKLNQKNGTYTVSASYTPVGGDTVLYLSSSQGVIFKLQAK